MVTFDICKGNPGALTFVMLAYEYNPYRAEAAFRRMQNNGITGDKLYMLWNDCCDRDVEQALVNMECMSMVGSENRGRNLQDFAVRGVISYYILYHNARIKSR